MIKVKFYYPMLYEDVLSLNDLFSLINFRPAGLSHRLVVVICDLKSLPPR